MLRGFVGDVPLEPASRDLATIWHVLEHTEDPRAVLRRLREVLVPGGLLVVEVPNIEATCQSPRSTFHDAHLYHFNIGTLRELAGQCGLRALRHELSGDGGNLTMVFAAYEEPVAPEGALCGNHARVAGALARHVPWRHLLRPATAFRTARRLAGALDERLALAGLRASGKALLDRLYDDALRHGKLPAGLPALRFGSLATAAVAGAWWLECELIDRAHHIGWSAAEGMAIYFALQAAVLTSVWWMARAAAPGRMRLRIAGLGLMLASMPVLH